MSKILLMLVGGCIFAFASVAVSLDANAADVRFKRGPTLGCVGQSILPRPPAMRS